MIHSRLLTTLCIVFTAACSSSNTNQQPVSRFETAAPSPQTNAMISQFCDKRFSANTLLPMPAFQALPNNMPTEPALNAPITWITLWASWCEPCKHEMPLLQQWKNAFNANKTQLRFEFWSIDQDATSLQQALQTPLPGTVRWIASQQDVDTLIQKLQLPADTAIPIHIIVNAQSQIQCVRVGAVFPENLPAAKALVESTR